MKGLRRLIDWRDMPVYGATAAAIRASVRPAEGLIVLDPATVRRTFDPARRDRFLRWLAIGHRGVMLAEDGVWASYAWLARPGTPPIHLPSFDNRHYWAFYGHTRPECRGRGLLRQALAGLAEALVVPEAGDSAWIFTDVEAGNTASRRAVLGAGFTPHGRLAMLRLGRGSRLHWCRWDPAADHGPVGAGRRHQEQTLARG